MSGSENLPMDHSLLDQAFPAGTPAMRLTLTPNRIQLQGVNALVIVSSIHPDILLLPLFLKLFQMLF